MNKDENLRKATQVLIEVTRKYVAPGIPDVDNAVLGAEIALRTHAYCTERPRYPHADEVEAALRTEMENNITS